MSVQSKVISSNELDETLFFPIDDYKYYEINKNGEIRNIKTNKLLRTRLRNGYYIVDLYNNGKRITKSIHKLIAETFLNKPNENYVVDHINCNRTDNRIENLRYVSQSQNSRNKLKCKKVTYRFVDEPPSNSIHIIQIKDYDITDVGLYFNKQTDEFYMKMADNKYRIMHKQRGGNSYRIEFKFNGKLMSYSRKQLIHDYAYYFN